VPHGRGIPWRTAIGAAAASIALVGCGPTAVVRPGTVLVVGAESQYADVLAQLGGRFVTAQAIISNPNVDPHTFEVGTSAGRAIASARLIVQNGAGYDAWMGQLESATSGSARTVLVAQQIVGAPAASFNPHLWYSPTTMSAVAVAIERALSTIEPAHAGYFAARLAAFEAEMASWRTAIDAFRAAHHGVTAAVTEPVADDLLMAMGITVRTPRQFQADVMNGVDPSPQDVATQQSLLDTGGVTLLAYNTQVTDSLTSSLRARARASGIPVVGVSELMPYGDHYVSWMIAETRAIADAVASHPSTGAR
jgi:zinc/manganese transport system substrate-binding protein